MKLTLGFSPCPNDTFIFDALVNKKIDSPGLEWDVLLEDVQTLNEWALLGKLDISKISYAVLPLILKEYLLLDSGGALGKGVGPLLVAKQSILPIEELDKKRIAIPGENTTAHMLFSLAFPRAEKKQFMIFSEIEEAVRNGKVDAGVIIHENRFTYQQKGLTKLMDLGEFWEQQTRLPIPLGGMVMKKQFDRPLRQKVDQLIRKSLQYAFAHYPAIPGYVKQHAQNMDEKIMRQHIDLYVNDYSLDLGKEGQKAVQEFLQVCALTNRISLAPEEIFST